MTNHILPNSKENPSKAKRKRVIAALAQELVSSDDDDILADGGDICNIIENERNQRKRTATSSALHTLGETIKNTLLEINEIREQNRERRHRELLQFLKKIVQQETTGKVECADSKVTNLNNEDLNHVNHVTETRYSVDQDLTENDVSDSSEVACNTCSSPTLECNLDQSHMGSATTANSMKLTAHKHQINKEQNSKIKRVIAVKNDDTKEELQKMRAKMLELQRQKMEDRERKKREFIKVTNT